MYQLIQSALPQAVAALIIGCLVGYGYGLSLLKQGRALALFSALPFIRIILIAILGYYLLHWGTIAFILFVGSFMVTVWTVLLKKHHTL